MFLIFVRLYHPPACRSVNYGLPRHRQRLHNENMPERSDYRDGQEDQHLWERGRVLPGWRSLGRWKFIRFIGPVRMVWATSRHYSRGVLLGICKTGLVTSVVCLSMNSNISQVITHIPGGILSEKFGGKYTLGLGILSTAIFTLITPLVINWGK